MNSDIFNSVVKCRHVYPWPRVNVHELFHCRLGGKGLERPVMISKTPCEENYIGSVPHKYQHVFRELLENRKTRIICEITGDIEPDNDKFQFEKGGEVKQACQYYIVRGIQLEEKHGSSTENQPGYSIWNSGCSAFNRKCSCPTVNNQNVKDKFSKPSRQQLLAQLFRSDSTSSSDDSSSSKDENARKKVTEKFSKPKTTAKHVCNKKENEISSDKCFSSKHKGKEETSAIMRRINNLKRQNESSKPTSKRSKNSLDLAANKTAAELKIKKEPLSPMNNKTAPVVTIKEEPLSPGSSSSSDDSSSSEDGNSRKKSAGEISKASSTAKKTSDKQDAGNSSFNQGSSSGRKGKSEILKQDERTKNLKRKHEPQKFNTKRSKNSTDVSENNKQNRDLQNHKSQSGKSAPSKNEKKFNAKKQKRRRENKSQASQQEMSVEPNDRKVILSKNQRRKLRKNKKNTLNASDEHCLAKPAAYTAGQNHNKAKAWQNYRDNTNRLGLFQTGSINTVVSSIKID